MKTTDATKARRLATCLKKNDDATKKLLNADLDAITDAEVLGLTDEFVSAQNEGSELLNELERTSND